MKKSTKNILQHYLERSRVLDLKGQRPSQTAMIPFTITGSAMIGNRPSPSPSGTSRKGVRSEPVLWKEWAGKPRMSL